MGGVTLNNLIEAAFKDEPRNHQRLGDEAYRYSRAVTDRFCPDIPEDLHDEIFDQAFVELFGFGVGALADQSGQALFRRAIINAMRVVLADYAPPGRRTRRPPKGAPPDKVLVAAEDVGRIADAKTLGACSVMEGEQTVIDFDRFVSRSAAAAFKQAEDRIEIEQTLHHAPPAVSTALRLIHFDNEPVSIAAEAVGLSRFALSRQVSVFRAALRLAA